MMIYWLGYGCWEGVDCIMLQVAMAVAVLCLVRPVSGAHITSAGWEPMASCGVDRREWYTRSRVGQGAHVGPPDPWSMSGWFVFCCAGPDGARQRA